MAPYPLMSVCLPGNSVIQRRCRHQNRHKNTEKNDIQNKYSRSKSKYPHVSPLDQKNNRVNLKLLIPEIQTMYQ